MQQQVFINDMRANFNLRRPKGDKPTNIYFVVRVGKRQLKLSTGVKVYPDHWNVRKQEAYISVRLSELDNLNNTIVNDKLEELKMTFSAYSYRLLLSQLRNHQIDGCICPKGLIVPLEHMAFLDLPPLQNVLLYSRKHCPPENGQEYTVKDFRKEKLLLLEQEDTSIPKAYQLGFLQDKGIIPETKEYHNIDSILLDVSLDKGFAISDIWSRGAFDRSLSCLKLDQKMPICVAWPENHSFDEMRLFANLFKESMESLQ